MDQLHPGLERRGEFVRLIAQESIKTRAEKHSVLIRLPFPKSLIRGIQCDLQPFLVFAQYLRQAVSPGNLASKRVIHPRDHYAHSQEQSKAEFISPTMKCRGHRFRNRSEMDSDRAEN